MTTFWIALPAYDEERALPALLERYLALDATLAARGARLHLLVVDDGSRDGTAAAARRFAGRLAVEVIAHGANRGLGAALRTGIAAALERADEADLIGTMDADDTHDPGLFPAMWERIEAHGADVAIASRYAPGGAEVGLTPLRRALSRGASLMLSLFAPVRGAHDYTCGFRLYRAATLRRAAAAWGDRLIEETGFTCMAELLLKLGRGGAKVVEVPLVLRYDRKEGASKMRLGRTVARYFALARRIRAGPVPWVARVAFGEAGDSVSRR